MDSIYLNLGAGSHKLPGFINVDLDPGADLQLDLTQRLPWDDSSVSGIYSEHFIEHVSHADAIFLLCECRRILKPGGTIRIATPDLQHLLADYAADRIHPDWEKFGMAWTANRCERLNIAMRWWGHQWIYDADELIRVGEMTGLSLKARHDFGRSDDARFANLEYRESSTLILEFGKPERRLGATDMPLVSITMPTFRPQFFEAALQSAINQTYRNIEIVICDDCPGDGIERITAIHAARDTRIRYLRNPAQLNRENLVKCVAEARGEFIKFLNDDDLLAPTCVERMLDCYRSTPDLALVTSRRRRIDAADRPLPDEFATRPPVPVDAVIEGLSVGAALVTPLANFVGEPSTVMFRKAEVAHLKPDFMAVDGHLMWGTNDVAAWANLATRGNVAYLVEPLSSFRIHAGQNQQSMREEVVRRGSEGLRILRASWERRGLLKGMIANTVKWKPLAQPSAPWALRQAHGDGSGWSDVAPAPRALSADEARHLEAAQLIRQGKEAEGAAILIEFVRSGSDYWPAYNDLAAYALRQGDRDAALELLRRAAELAPEPGVASLNLARVLIDAHLAEEARDVLARHLAARPDDAGAQAMAAELGSLAATTGTEQTPAAAAETGSAPVVVIIPIYRKALTPFEIYGLDRSLSVLQNRDVLFIGPQTLDTAFYSERYPGVPFVGLDPRFFASLEGYNELLLSTTFYDAFANYEFMLVLQTDALLLRDELDHWCAQPFDFIGAPWPNGGFSMTLDMARFAGGNAKTVVTAVGNGGMSLRRIARCSALLREFDDVVRWFNESESSEDIFFSFVGTQSKHFSLPDELTASRFSLEFTPSTFLQKNGGSLPMGAHQWWQQAPEFWLPLLADAPPLVRTMLERRADFYRIPGDVLVAAPLSMELITSYVLREQGDWFEDEIRFVREALRPGECTIDIGANFGVFTLSIAKAVGDKGHVWAFEPASSTAAMLATSIEANGFANTTVLKCAVANANGSARLSLNEHPEANALVSGASAGGASEEVPLVTLDHCLETYRWPDIALLKIDAEGQEENILRGGPRFFAERSPLVQYEIKEGTGSNHYELVQRFTDLGYASYRLVPGLGLLVPVDAQAHDPFMLNLFACKADRAARLAAQGHLVEAAAIGPGRFEALREALQADFAPGGKYHWQQSLAPLPYAKALAGSWAAASGGATLVEALGLHACSQDPARSGAERFLALREAFALLERICGADPAHLRLISLARVASEFGARLKAVEALACLVARVSSLSAADLYEPFLAAARRFEAIDPGTRYAEWVGGSVLEQQEKLYAYSSFYAPETSRERLDLIIKFGFASDEMHRRADLVRLRLGTQAA